MSGEERKDPGSSLTIDRAAFLLLRVKRVFKKRKQQRKEKTLAAAAAEPEVTTPTPKGPPPLLRSRTLPAIVVPGINILHAQIDSKYKSTSNQNVCTTLAMLSANTSGAEDSSSSGGGDKYNLTKFNVLPPSSENTLDPRRHLIHHRLSSPEPSQGMMDAMLRLPSPSCNNTPRLSTCSASGTTTTALYRLAKLLNQKEPSQPRRLSWETDGEELSCIPRSSSIDSMVESKNCSPLSRRLPSPLLVRTPPSGLPPPLSPSVARRMKGQRALTDGASTGPNPIKESVPPTRGKKLPRMDIHLHALFAAVEHGHVEKARTILESTDVDVNSANSDGLSPLDVAVLSNNRQLTKMLIAFGAREGNQFGSSDKLSSHLHQLAREADHHVQELGGSGGETDNRTYTQTASDKTLALWERRSRGLNKMILGFDQARPPDVPFLVVADVTGTDSVTVRYQEPEHHDSPVCTKYRVEWSCCPDFGALAGFIEVLDPRQLECHVDGLDRGRRYYFRVACGNIRGFGNFRMSYPQSIIPSSWRDVVQKEERLPSSGLALFDRLFQEVRSARPDLKGVGSPSASGETPLGQRRKKTTIKQLFTAASKFQKHLRRGVYFSCLLYNEDKVLVTNEDFLPVIEVDETYPGSIYHDFHWLLKVACTWDDVKWLKQDMEKSLSSSAVHFRIKLLQAAVQMQTALSIQDLGQLYHKPLRDSEGTIVVCTVNYVKSPKSVSVLNSRWLPLGKLTKRAVQPTSETSIGDILMASIQEQITYHQVSSIRLPRGLYLGYLKMRSSVDLLQVLVPTKSPNVPPHCKIRDNSHVTAEEWEWLRIGCASNDCTEQQKDFVEQVAATARRLFTYMEVPCDEAPSHRLYDGEVVELSSEVSFLMVVPPPESACAAPGQRDLLLQRPDLVPLPVQVFEMVHMGTYQKQLVSRYSRLSCILELDTALAQHSHREAFSSSEVSVARERLARLEGLQAQLNAAWKSARWLLDVLAFARDRLAHSPTSIRHLLQKRSRDHLEASHNGLLQPPDPKSVKSRGSWPGPGVARLLGSCTAEMSRSDQHLSGGAPPPPPTPHQLLHAHTPSPSSSPNRPAPPPLPPPRPTPARPPPPNDHIETIRLPPSRSEDTLHMHTRITPRTRATVSATTSPLLPSRPTGYGSGSLQSSSEESALANQSSKSEGEAEEEGATVPAPAPGILQVYAAYETGLAAGTSLKLHVSPRTSAREVVDLVVKQLNMAVVLKGKDGPIYAADQLSNFCLVAVIGARERCLRDDFKPLQLQNPWKKGRLYVRQKHDVLAALEHSSRHSALL